MGKFALAMLLLVGLAACDGAKREEIKPAQSEPARPVIAPQALASGPLDGKIFCRDWISDDPLTPPEGVAQHCLSFANGKSTDNSATPAEVMSYSVVGNVIHNNDSDRDTAYQIEGDNIVLEFGGQRLVMEPRERLIIEQRGEALVLEGKRFCRAVGDAGQHCVSFADGIMRDNANTFFGNPPESIPYALSAGVIQNSETQEPTYSAIDGDHLVYGEQRVVMTLSVD